MKYRNMNTISMDNLLEFCTSNKRVCPKPNKWSELFKLLKNKKQNSDGGWTPSLPLILAAWYDASASDKQLRFKEHIQWAIDHDQTEEVQEYLNSIKEDEWVHFDEI